MDILKVTVIKNLPMKKIVNTEHYWKKGYLGKGFQTYIDALNIIDNIEFSEEEKNEEKYKILETKKDALGGNLTFLPGVKFFFFIGINIEV